MTIRTTLNHLQAARHTLDGIINDYTAWHRWIASTIADGYPTGVDYNAGSSGDISDPTANTALARQRDTRHLLDAAQLAEHIHAITTELNRIISAGPARIDTAAIAKSARCSGAVDATCTRLADGRRHKTGLCDVCWQQQYRQQRQAS